MYGGGRAEATMSYCLFDKLELFKLYDLFFLFLNDVRECGQPVALPGFGLLFARAARSLARPFVCLSNIGSPTRWKYVLVDV